MSTVQDMADRYGQSVFRIGVVLYGPAHVTFGEDAVTDADMAVLRDYYGE